MIAAVLVLVWAAYGALGPVVLKGRSAKHNAFAVWMHSADTIGNHLPSVLVQEVGEWRLSKIVGVACAIPGLLLVSDPAMQALAAVLPMLIADAVSRLIPASDYAGHGAEIIAAERAGLIGYRAAEIERMRLFDNRQHMTTAQVDAALRRWNWLARIVWRLGR